MPIYLENLNMEFFRESEDRYNSLIGLAASEGKGIYGYYGFPYLNKHLGSVQIVLRTGYREPSEEFEGKCFQVEGMDTHTSGRSVWEVRVHGMNIGRKDADLLEKRIAVTRMDGGGIAVVNLVNADVLPSFMKDDVIRMQMVAFPDLIEYYKDEEDYAAHQPKSEDGQKWLIGEETVFPTGLMRNRNPQSKEFETDENLDDLTIVRGVVKSLYWGKIEFEGETHNAYLKCIVDTDFGELEIVHTVDQVAEEFRSNMEIGATVLMYGVLSGDVAIYEYDKGVIRDEEHNLAAMRYMFAEGDPERIRSILSKDVKYISQSGEEFTGVDEVVERFKYVKKVNPDKYFAHFASISSVNDGEEEVEYGVDKLCLILASKEENNYESIAFFDYDQEGNICRIVTSKNPRYRFSIRTRTFCNEETEAEQT